ncbi:MAG TPA: PaaI family thioesterase [Solirubrobacteraceae bacterium]
MNTVPAIRERTFTWDDPLATAARAGELDGVDFLRAIAAGEIPRPPIAALLDMTMVEVEHGRVVFELQPAEWMYNPIGSVHGGIAATILDSCMGCAVHSTLAAGERYTTTDLQIRYLGAMSSDMGAVHAEGRVIQVGGRVAAAEGRVYAVGNGERTLAHGTTGCLIMR